MDITGSWHKKEINEAIEDLDSSIEGISKEEAQKRFDKYGPNELKEKKKKTVFMMFLDQFKDFMILVLIAAAVISGIVGDPEDTIAIIVIVLLNAVIGFVQEFRAEKAMEALKKMAAPSAVVMRDAMPATIAASEIVPGDIVILEAGNIVPADLRIIESAMLKTEEAALTGESLSVEKHADVINEDKPPLGDRKNMAYKGTTVSYGRGQGLVVSTGMNTELGKIASMIQDEDEVKTPLQKRLAVFGQRLAMAIFVICAIVFGLGIMRGEEPVLMLLTAISLAVAAIPEALPAVVTISLALGARKLIKQNALIRKLPAVETLGSVTYICSDKTGTLTLNKMTVEEIWVDGKLIRAEERKSGSAEERKLNYGINFFLIKNFQTSELPNFQTSELPSFRALMTALALSNDAKADAEGNLIGDPTETALYSIAKDNGFNKTVIEQTMPRVAEIPFDSERKRMTTFHSAEVASELPSFQANFVSFTKGAIESLIDDADNMFTSEGIKPVDKAEILKVSERMAADGLRVLCIAMRKWDSPPAVMSPENVEAGLTILGLAGLMDPPREEAKEAIRLCKTAGIKPVMITGDHPATAAAIAHRLGIIEDKQGVMTGRALQELSLEDFERRVDSVSVYARVAPEQKLKIVRALQDKGQFVAMTGDGVNDAPALKRADIGIAMGITGTDVSKEASKMILLDDNFATIVRAVKEGRRIFDNIRKFIKYTMTSNSGEMWTIFLAPFFGLPVPLLPIHILWINLVTDGLPGLALAAEPSEKGIMNKPPRHPQESIFAHGLGVHIIWVGLLMGFVSIFTQAWSIQTGHAHWQTMVFTVLCLSQMGHVLAIRSDSESLFSQGLFSNKPLLGAFLLTFALQMATIYIPFLNPVFKTEPLSFDELIFTLALSSVVFFAVEIEKLIRRKRWPAL